MIRTIGEEPDLTYGEKLEVKSKQRPGDEGLNTV